MIIVCVFLIFFSIYFIRLEKNKSLLLSIGILYLVELVWGLASCAYLDYNNAYIIETGKTSYYTGAFFRMLLLYLPFLILVSLKVTNKFSNVYKKPLYIKKINKQHCIKYILIVTLLVILYCVLDMVISGIPMFSTIIGRQNYSKYSTLPFVMKINGEVTFFGVLVAGIAFFTEDNKDDKKGNIKKLALSIFIISIIYRILMEYKYHGMYNIIYAFSLPGLIVWLKKRNYHCISFKNIVKLILGMTTILLLCYYTYLNVNKSFDAKSLLFDRIFTLQAHTFWGMDKVAWIDEKCYTGYEDSLEGEINAVKNDLGERDINSGIIDVMYKVANPIAVDANVDKGIRWAGSYLTVGINTIGYLGTFILSIVISIIIIFDMKMFYAAIYHCEFITLYLAQSLFWDLLDYFRIGNWCILLNTKTIIVFGILLLMYMLKCNNIKNFEQGSIGEI